MLRAASLRARIDRAGRDAWEHAVGGSVGGRMKRHETRAFLGAAALEEPQVSIAHFRLLKQVYEELSDIMHGRWSAAHVTSRQAEEWEAVVDAILGKD